MCNPSKDDYDKAAFREDLSEYEIDEYQVMEEYFRDPDASKGYDIAILFLKKNFKLNF